MKVQKAHAEIISPVYFHEQDILKHIETCGRVCYKSENKITNDSYESFIDMIFSRNHFAVIEHFTLTAKFVCDRGVSHEIVRHRLASYCQESTRYCNYSNDKFGGEITVIEPCYLEKDTSGYAVWYAACLSAEKAYFDLLEWGATPQEARAVLPTCLKTEIVMTANLREWLHFFSLRTAPAAHPQMREVATQLLDEMTQYLPVFFGKAKERGII